MSRKYSAWASNQPLGNPDLSMMRLATVMGNEQDQLKNFERVEAIPHMYINVDAPPPPPPASTTTKNDARGIQPAMISRQNSSYLAVPTPTNVLTKIWPMEKPSKNPSSLENISSSSKRHHNHKHKHHHHHHHSDKHHHHRHHSRRHRAKSAESIRNRQFSAVMSPSKVMLANPQYIEQEQLSQQQQQQQPMIVYREVSNGEGYTIDPNGLATVPYGADNETTFVDDQQAPMFVYRDANIQPQQQTIMSDGISQQYLFNQDQDTNIGRPCIPLQSVENKLISQRVTSVNETQVGNYSSCICTQTPVVIRTNPLIHTGCIQEIERIYIEDTCCVPSPTMNCISGSYIIQQTEPFIQQPSSQIVYCTDPTHQDYHCTSNHNNIIQQSISPSSQQQFVCVDNMPTSTIQPTIINQIPVFNPLSTNSTSQSLVTIPQTSLQRTTSVVIQQPQPQTQPLQIVQQPQPLQIIQQPQPLQVIQQPQPLQIIQNPQTHSGQILQLAPAAPQVIQTIQPQMIQAQPQVIQAQPQMIQAQPQFIQAQPQFIQAQPHLIQAQPLLQTIQMPNQAVAATPQILYQRPYDPVLLPVQNQQMAIANSPLVALSQPSYAPSRIVPAAGSGQQSGPAMFRHALLRTVADRAGVPVATPSTSAVQLVQPTAAAPVAANPNLVVAGGMQRSASLPIIPLTPGGILIPFQPSQTPGLRPGPLPRAGGYPTNLRNFNDIRQQMQQRRDQLFQSLQQATYNRAPSPPVITATPRNPTVPYSTGNPFASGPRPGATAFPRIPPGTYTRLPSPGAYTRLPTPGAYTRLPTPGLSYAQPSLSGSVRSSPYTPYNPLRS